MRFAPQRRDKLRRLVKKASASDAWYTAEVLQKMLGVREFETRWWRQLQSWERNDLASELVRIVMKGNHARPPHLQNYTADTPYVMRRPQESIDLLKVLFERLRSSNERLARLERAQGD